ncbi:adenylate/guanylate cyclase domain-containing protein [soil metagenome]
MICLSCGTANQADRKFCGECGAPLAIVCASCGASNVGNVKFCGQCGSLLGSSAAQGSPGAEGTAAPASSLRPAAAAERRLVTVLFADLVGFTSLSEQRDAEEMRELLTRYFDLCRTLVLRYGGVVEKFIGDAVMAVWGTPVAHEDDAERAVRAALEMVDAVAALGVQIDVPDLRLRAGVLTGEAAVTIGAEGQGMVAGDLVNTASRLQSAAIPGTVLAGRSTYLAAAKAIAFEEAGRHALKGKELPVEAWRALRVTAGHGGFRRSEGMEAPFVGRDEELRLIKNLFHAVAREGRPRLVSVMGIGGIGKSRLAWEFFKYIDGLVETTYWHQGRCPAYGEGITFWALGEMVRMRARIVENEGARATRDKLAVTVAEFVKDADERRWIEPRLAHLLGLEETSSEREELFAAWRSFLEHISDDGPVLLLFEDLHWADPTLIDFIEHVLEWSRNHPVLILTLARPELMDRRPTWGAGQRSFTSIYLEPLPEQAMTGLLEGLARGLPARLLGQMVERAEGVPLYGVEMVRMLVDRGDLVPDDGSYRLTRPLERLDVPDSLHSLIASRLDALPPPDRALLQDAAVLGKTFTLDALAAVADADDDVEARLKDLARRELLTVENDPRSPERGQYGFMQSLIQEICLATLSKKERESRHLRAARYFESVDEGELAGVIANHYLEAYRAAPEGGDRSALAARARAAQLVAATRSESLGAHRQALSYLEQALSVTGDEAERGELWQRAAQAAQMAVDFDVAESYARRAVAFHEARNDRSATTRATAFLGRVLLGMGQVDPAIEILEGTLADTTDVDVDVDPAVIDVMAELARAFQFKADPERSIQWADRAVLGAARAGRVPVVADVLITKGTAAHLAGRTHEGQALAMGALHLAQKNGLVVQQLRAWTNASFMLGLTDPRECLEAARSGLDIARKLGSREWELALGGNACEAAIYSGEWDWAKETLTELVADELPDIFQLHLGVIGATLAAFEGDAEGASARLRAIEPLAAASSSPQDLGFFRVAEAWFALTDDRPRDAYEKAAATLRTDTGAGYEFMVVLVGGHAAVRLRDRSAAETVLRASRRLRVFGPCAEVIRKSLASATVALGGRRDLALAQYLDTTRAWRELGLPFQLALTQIDFITLLGVEHDDGRAAADEARTILERLGAKPFLAQLDRALSAGN